MEDLEKQLTEKGLKTAFGREAILRLFEKVWFRRGQLLLVPGQTSQSIYYISRGLVRGYKRYEGYEDTSWFALENHFLIPEGCFSGHPVGEYVEVLEDSEGFVLPLRQAQRLMAEIPQLSLVFLQLLEDCVLQGKRREEMLRLSAAADRYRFLQESYPYVVRQASQEILASYLHLSPKHLSRVRKEEAKGRRANR
jgi:CRP/FNR family transcriptional regulator, anaerobic regulatory protein